MTTNINLPMLGTYIVEYENQSVSAAVDLFELKAASDIIAVVYELGWHQTSSSATNEILSCPIKRVSSASTSGSGGSSPTKYRTSSGLVAASSTVEVLNTTQISIGSTDYHLPLSINGSQLDRKITMTRRDQVIISPSQFFVWQLNTAPTTTLTLSAYIKWAEFGG